MRFRREEWNVAMPPALVAYWDMWNENDLTNLRPLIDTCAVEDIEWLDPRDSFVGRNELEACARRLKERKPTYRFVIASEVDGHHDRLRYRWNMLNGERTLMEGLDIVTLAPDGLIARVEGFFGEPTPAKAAGGVPGRLQQDGIG